MYLLGQTAHTLGNIWLSHWSDENEENPIDFAISNGSSNNDETVVLLRKHGGKTSE